MKKFFLLIFVWFLVSCGSQNSQEISQSEISGASTGANVVPVEVVVENKDLNGSSEEFATIITTDKPRNVDTVIEVPNN